MALPNNIFELFPNHRYNIIDKINKITPDIQFKVINTEDAVSSNKIDIAYHFSKSEFNIGVTSTESNFGFLLVNMYEVKTLFEKNYPYYIFSMFCRDFFKTKSKFYIKKDSYLSYLLIKKHMDTLNPIFGVSINLIKNTKTYILVEVSFDNKEEEIILKYEKNIIKELNYIKNNFKEDSFNFVHHYHLNRLVLDLHSNKLKSILKKYIGVKTSTGNPYLMYSDDSGEFHLNNFLLDPIKNFGIGKMLFNKVLKEFKVIYSPNTTQISKLIYNKMLFDESLYVILTKRFAIYIDKTLNISDIKKRFSVSIYPNKTVGIFIESSGIDDILYIDDELKNILESKYLFYTFIMNDNKSRVKLD